MLFSNRGNECAGGMISAKECHDQLFQALALHNAFLGKAHNDIKPDNLFVMEVMPTHEDSKPQRLRLFLTDWGDSGSTVGTLLTRAITSLAFTPLSVLLGLSKDFLPYSRDTHCAVMVVLNAAIGKPLVDYMGLEVPNIFRERMLQLWNHKERAHLLPHLKSHSDIVLRTTYALLVAIEDPIWSLLLDVDTRWPDLQLRELLKSCEEFNAHVLEFSLRVDNSKLAKKVLEQELNPLVLARGLHPDPSLAPTARESLHFMNGMDEDKQQAKRKGHGHPQAKKKRKEGSSYVRTNVMPGTSTTPEAPPLFLFRRCVKNGPDFTDGVESWVNALKLTQTLAEMKKICLEDRTSKVFRLPKDDVEAVKNGDKILKVRIGGSWTASYQSVKSQTVQQIWSSLLENEKTNRVTLTFFLEDVKQDSDASSLYSDDE
jgi:serine/threonine protein kinase